MLKPRKTFLKLAHMYNADVQTPINRMVKHFIFK